MILLPRRVFPLGEKHVRRAPIMSLRHRPCIRERAAPGSGSIHIPVSAWRGFEEGWLCGTA